MFHALRGAKVELSIKETVGDLHLQIIKSNDQANVQLFFNSNIFKKETIEIMYKDFYSAIENYCGM